MQRLSKFVNDCMMHQERFKSARSKEKTAIMAILLLQGAMTSIC